MVSVIPATAGIQTARLERRIPAFAGMTHAGTVGFAQQLQRDKRISIEYKMWLPQDRRELSEEMTWLQRLDILLHSSAEEGRALAQPAPGWCARPLQRPELNVSSQKSEYSKTKTPN